MQVTGNVVIEGIQALNSETQGQHPWRPRKTLEISSSGTVDLLRLGPAPFKYVCATSYLHTLVHASLTGPLQPMHRMGYRYKVPCLASGDL